MGLPFCSLSSEADIFVPLATSVPSSVAAFLALSFTARGTTLSTHSFAAHQHGCEHPPVNNLIIVPRCYSQISLHSQPLHKLAATVP